MTTRIQGNVYKAIFLIVLFIILFLQTITADAQTYRTGQALYKGFVVSFATRSSVISSDIQKIDQTNVLQAGGRIGFIFGNSIVRSKVGLLGYYAATGQTAGSINLYQSNIGVNFYPLSLITGKNSTVEPYLAGGVDYDQFKFYGFYLNREPGETNYSQAQAPYLGKIKEINATLGAGIEVKLKDDYDFIHFFTEVRYGNNLSRKTADAAFAHTTLARQTQIIAGLTFGAHR